MPKHLMISVIWMLVLHVGTWLEPPRLAAQDQASETQDAAVDPLELYEPDEFRGMPYRLLRPIDLAANPDRAYPLILSLHGKGGVGTDNRKNLRVWNATLAEESLRRKHPCFVVVPQTTSSWVMPGSTPELTDERIAELPKIWRPVAQRRRQRSRAGNRLGELDKVFALLDKMTDQFNIDKDRVYVLGHSMGGFGTWSAIMEEPDRFAAAIPTAGGCAPWCDMKRIADVPIWTFHGNADPTVPVALTRYAFEQLQKIGANTKYTELDGVRHNANMYAFDYTGDDPAQGMVTQCASDRCDKTPHIWDWLFAQQRNP